MQKRTLNRLLATLAASFFIISGIVIVLYNLNKNIIFFYPPSQIDKIEDINKTVRIGGIVKPGSIINLDKGQIKFLIADDISGVEVLFNGIIPALFRENQGVVVKGHFKNNLFIAEELLTKHDEKYYP